jgi:hypothetical protein
VKGPSDYSRRLHLLFNRWRAELASDGCKFVRDGIIGGEREWQSSNPRILFLAKEPNDRGEILRHCGHDLRRLFRKPAVFSGHRRTFEKNLGRWAYGLHNAMADTRHSFGEADRDQNSYRALLRSAIINLKKTPGGGQSTELEIRNHTRRSRRLMMEQINLMSPTVVICCGTFRFIHEFVTGFPRDAQPGAWRWHENILWIAQCHPSARASPYEMYSRLVITYQRAQRFPISPA